jgi:hypothetical protein
MSTANDILGKIGEKVGSEFSNLRVSLSTNYATQVSLGNVVNTIDFSPYATKVSLNGVVTSLGNARVSLGGRITNLENAGYATTGEVSLKASKVSINNLKNGTDIFSVLSATRAEIGDLNVTGTTTTINTQTLSVEDNIIEVNLKSDGTETAQTGGLEVNRGGGTQASYTSNYSTGYGNLVLTKATGTDNVTAITFERNGSSVTYTQQAGRTNYVSHYDQLGSFDDASAYEFDNGTANPDFIVFADQMVGGVRQLVSIAEYIWASSASSYIVNFTYTSGSVVNDKAKFIWDDSGQGSFKALLGSTATTLEVGVLKVPNSSGIKINNVNLGDYSTFETAFLAEL